MILFPGPPFILSYHQFSLNLSNMKYLKWLMHSRFVIRLSHWEYWPFHIVYGPLYIYWIWICIKARSFFFFNTANPSIKNGGLLMESKKAIYDLMPAGHYPITLFFKAGIFPEKVFESIKDSGLSFPLIAKPDIGLKGVAVSKVDNWEELRAYIFKSKVDFLVQEFVPYANEVGIFYYRYPGQATGNISGIVKKELLTVIGDGNSSIEQLLRANKRFILQLPALREVYGAEWQNVLEKGEERLLVPYGNHSRGAKFVDISHLINEQLIQSIDSTCKNIDGFYFGRLDIRYSDWNSLCQGKNFSIIELNGAGSEPTHIYDPTHSIFFAWKEITRHWNILYRISRLNHRNKKLPYLAFRNGVRMLLENKDYFKLIDEQQKITA